MTISYGAIILRESRSVVGLQKLLYVIFGIEDFVVYAVVWKAALVAVVLRGAASGMRRVFLSHSVEAASRSPGIS